MLGCCDTPVRQHSTDRSRVQTSSHHCYHKVAHHIKLSSVTATTRLRTTPRALSVARMYATVSKFLHNLENVNRQEPSVKRCVKLAGGLKISMYWNFANGSSVAWESRCAQPVRREFSCGAKLLSVRWLSAAGACYRYDSNLLVSSSGLFFLTPAIPASSKLSESRSPSSLGIRLQGFLP